MTDTGAVTAYYVWGLGLLARFNTDGSYLNDEVFHFDPHGNTLALTQADETTTQAFGYDPFGLTADSISGSGLALYNPYRHGGEWGVMDDGSGLLSMRARHYCTRTHAFLSQDAVTGTLQDPSTFNRYAYARGNPLTYVDPSGNVIDIIWDAGVTLWDTGQLIGHTAAAIRTGKWDKQTFKQDAKDIGSDVLSVFIPGVPAGLNKVGRVVTTQRIEAGKRLLQKIYSNEYRVMAGKGVKKKINDINRLVKTYGGRPNDWQKITSRHETLMDGSKIQIHAYRNDATGKIYEPKPK